MEHTETSEYFWSLRTLSALDTKSPIKAPQGRQIPRLMVQ